MGKRLTTIAALITVAGTVLFPMSRPPRHRVSSAVPPGPPPVAAGEEAPDFALQNLDEKTVTLSSLRGKAVFLNVWATWCAACREEMPSIEKLYQRLKHNSKFVMLAVSEDRKGKAAVAPFIKQGHYHFPVLLDPGNKVGDAYDVSGVPETFLIDHKGRIAAHYLGALDWSHAESEAVVRDLIDGRRAVISLTR